MSDLVGMIDPSDQAADLRHRDRHHRLRELVRPEGGQNLVPENDPKSASHAEPPHMFDLEDALGQPPSVLPDPDRSLNGTQTAAALGTATLVHLPKSHRDATAGTPGVQRVRHDRNLGECDVDGGKLPSEQISLQRGEPTDRVCDGAMHGPTLPRTGSALPKLGGLSDVT